MNHQTASNAPFTCEFCNEKHAPFGPRCKNRLMDVAKAMTNPPSKQPGIDSAPQPVTNADGNASGTAQTLEAITDRIWQRGKAGFSYHEELYDLQTLIDSEVERRLKEKE